MTDPTPQEQALSCLRDGGLLADPRFLPPRQAAEAEELLKARCRACYRFREWWPGWIRGYADRWIAEAESARSKEA